MDIAQEMGTGLMLQIIGLVYNDRRIGGHKWVCFSFLKKITAERLSMRSSISILSLLTTGFISGFCLAQDEPSTPDKKPSGNLDVTIELYSSIMIQLYEKTEPTDEQRTRIRQVIDAHIPELVRSRDRLQTMFTPEQQKTFNAALKLANNAKYTPDKAEAYALKKLKLPESELNEYITTKAKADGLQTKMDSEVAALLTDEQKAKLPMFQSEVAKTSLVKFKLPNMKTQQDAKSIWQELLKVKGATEFKPDVTNQTVELRVPTGTAIKEKLAELVQAGNTLVADFEMIPVVDAAEPKGRDAKDNGSSDKEAGGS